VSSSAETAVRNFFTEFPLVRKRRTSLAAPPDSVATRKPPPELSAMRGGWQEWQPVAGGGEGEDMRPMVGTAWAARTGNLHRSKKVAAFSPRKATRGLERSDVSTF